MDKNPRTKNPINKMIESRSSLGPDSWDLDGSEPNPVTTLIRGVRKGQVSKYLEIEFWRFEFLNGYVLFFYFLFLDNHL